MIIDKLEHLDLYTGLGKRIHKALLYLRESKFGEMKDGRYEIDGDDIYMTISRYQTKPFENGKWESHKKYIDVQFIAGGSERVGYSNISGMKIIEEYNKEKDVQFLSGTGNFITADKNTFIILFPHDVHMPGLSIDNNLPQQVIKVVIKVKAD